MVNPDYFKRKLEKLISQAYRIEFLGENFAQIAGMLTSTQEEKIYKWISDVIEREIQPIFVGSTKKYKKWAINQLLVFRYPFTLGNTKYRILLVKVKNSIYIEFHLGDHKYYDKVRKTLDLKKSSY
ncbi:MAG: hypothetical protein ABIB47_01995 [Candidatus Woesearchaeota archaeon]